MNGEELKKELEKIAVCFYQERIPDGMKQFPELMGALLQRPEYANLIEPIMEAVERQDYVLAADIFHFEMAEKIR